MKKENYYLEFHKKVKNDLLDIQNYIIENYFDIYAADKLTNKFFKSFLDLTYLPDAYQFIDDNNLKLKGVRVKKIRRYNIYYKVEDDVVVILMVSNSKRSFMNVVDELVKRM